MNYIPSWLNDTYTLLQKLQKCIEKIENISSKEIPDAIKPIQTEIDSIKTDIASLETDCAFVNKVNTFTKPQVIRRGTDTTSGMSIQEGTADRYDYTDYSHGHITKTKNNKGQTYTYNLPDKSGDIALKSDISADVVNGQEEIYTGSGNPAQVKMHAGSSSFDAYLELIGGSGSYKSRIYPWNNGAYTQVNYILPKSDNQSDSPEMQFFLSNKNVKTLFGNKSIYGSGNIDLYKHDIKVEFSGSEFESGANVHIIVYSSKNTVVDSLADLKTLLGNIFTIGIFGHVMHNDAAQTTHATPYIPLYADQNGMYFSDNGAWLAVPFVSEEYLPTISDTITTI